MKLETALNDAADLRQQIELKVQEVKNVTSSLESLRSANGELEVCPRPCHQYLTHDPASVQDHGSGDRGRQVAYGECQGHGARPQDNGGELRGVRLDETQPHEGPPESL